MTGEAADQSPKRVNATREVRSMTVALLIELIGVCLVGPRATEPKLEMNLAVSDRDEDAWILSVCRRVVHAS